jgi:hypothetical protein
MSNKINMADIALPQEVLKIDDVNYLVNAMPATKGLQFMEAQQESIESGKADLALMKQVICAYVSKDGIQITDKSFDIVFARKFGHLRNLYQAVIEWNFGEVFEQDGGEE